MKISCSIVLYNNNLEKIDNLIDNFFQATKDIENTQIYLINNSNTNNKITKHINELQKQNSCISAIIPERNVGFGAGHNRVLPLLDSDYHFIINPDIIIPDEKELDSMIEFLEDNLDYGMLAPLIKYPNGKVQHLLKRQSNVWDMFLRFIKLPIFKKRQANFICLPDGYTYIHHAENVPGSFLMIRTKIFKKINGFDEKYFLYMEDSDLTMKVNQISSTVFFPDAYVYHEWQRDNQKSVKGIIQMLKSMKIYFDKWGWRLW